MAGSESRTQRATQAPQSLAALVDRFAPEVFDLPGNRAVIRLAVSDADDWDVVVEPGTARIEPAGSGRADALLSADSATWDSIAGDLGSGMDAFRSRRLSVRRNLHLGVGFLAATSEGGPGRLRFRRVRARGGSFSVLEAGIGDPVVMLHGLGGTKASFLPTVAALAPSYRVIAVDMLGFGDSDKPIGAPYTPQFQARAIGGLLDALEIDRTHLIGHSMGGRVAIEVGLRYPHRTHGLVLMTPAVAWLRERQWAPYLKLLRPELGLIQVAPRPVVEAIVRRLIPAGDSPAAAPGIDEFIRTYTTARGRAAFYAAARSIYLDEPHGDAGFWTQLRKLAPESLFIWGRHDRLVPIKFIRHVENALPQAEHVELDCGHIPQIERPRETHEAMLQFLSQVRPAAIA